jgi:enterochelin esterase-like enzyme
LPAPELTVKEGGVPKGKVIDFVMKSEESKIYPAAPAGRRGPGGPFERRAALYIPSQYVPGTEAPFMVIQDGVTQARTPGSAANGTGFYHDFLPLILDNMIAERRLPVMLLVLIQPGPGDGPGSQRGLEYDTVSDRYTTFIETEVLPKIEKEQNVKFTKDPEGRGTAGGSSGAACALTMAWFHPELYRKVLSYSGTFVNQAQNEIAPRGAWEYHQTLIPKAETKPIRIWLEVGQLDNGNNQPEAGLHNWVIANDHMAEVLKAKGYHYQYVFAEGARHVDRAVIAATMAGAMEWLWKDYKAN